MNNLIYRQWCKKCEEFTLHQSVLQTEVDHPKYSLCSFEKDFATICECGNQYSTVMAIDIPVEKREEQIARYKKSQSMMIGDHLEHMTILAMGVNEEDALNDVKKDPIVIIESDAGYVEAMRIQHEKNMAQKHEFNMRYAEIYSKLGRNDKCGCGSGIKYKKCCMDSQNQLRRYFND